jgi:4-methyl-5(b-hydroxyethyl)-thiazole monophosphate biosynthesis
MGCSKQIIYDGSWKSCCHSNWPGFADGEVQKMKRVLMPIVDGFEEIEAITPLDLLKRAGCYVATAGHTVAKATGSHQLFIGTTTTWDSDVDPPVTEEKWDAIVLAGGPGTFNYSKISGLHEFIREMVEQEKLVAAICAAPTVLHEAGVLKNRRVCCYPAVEAKLTEVLVSQEDVVYDPPILTSRGAGTAIPFSLKLIEILMGPEKADEIAQSIVYMRQKNRLLSH